MRYIKKSNRHLREWHMWFAWHPVKIKCVDGDYYVWLEKVERRFLTGSTYRHDESRGWVEEIDVPEYKLK